MQLGWLGGKLVAWCLSGGLGALVGWGGGRLAAGARGGGMQLYCALSSVQSSLQTVKADGGLHRPRQSALHRGFWVISPRLSSIPPHCQQLQLIIGPACIALLVCNNGLLWSALFSCKLKLLSRIEN